MRIKSKMILLLGTLLISLTACSAKDSADSEQIYTYIPTYRELSAKEGTILTAFLCNDEIIFETSTDETGLRRQQTFYSLPLTEDETEAREISFVFSRSQVQILDIIKDSEGNYYTLESDHMLGRVVNGMTVQEGFKMVKYGPDGSSLASWNLTECLLQYGEGTYLKNLAMDGDGNIYVLGYNAMLLFDSQGNYQGIITNEQISCMACGADGRLYYSCNFDQLKRVDFDTATGENVTRDFPLGTGMCLGDDSELWVYDIDGVYRYDTQKQMPTQIINWLNADVDPTLLTDMTVMPDGQILLLMLERSRFPTQSPQLVSLAKTEGEDTSRETITVGVMSLTDNMRACALQFNQSHPECHVQIKEYMGNNGYRDREDAMRALDLDLVSGKTVDIIALSYADTKKYLSKELLEDLKPYLEASTALSKENLVDVVEETYTFDGKLVALPTRLTLNVFVGRQSQFGDIRQWSVKDMIAFFEQNKNPTVLSSASKSDILDVCLAFNLGYFADTQEKTCRFDTEEFSQIMEFSNQFTGTDDTGGWPCIYQDDGRRLLRLQSCSNPSFAACAPQYFNNEPVSYFGYPTIDGQSGIMLSTDRDAYAILTTSGHKEVAWAFLETAILTEGQINTVRGHTSDIISMDFPIMIDQLEEQFAASIKAGHSEQLGQDDQTGRRYTTAYYFGTDIIYLFAPLQEEVDLMWELIDQARPAPQYDETIMGIIQEEAAGYFAWDKDIKIVTATIQNRVQLYLNES